ncbi:hypothetical protein KVH22_25495 [Streptomyces olivaceus]|uniref:hypothetical protein n=1 Tax=Streptomyces olivaceus TaxID=47716 RepID=UPI001CCCF6AD|nr:hypothetical protein [Streptomyces olivaceus]MBZ6258874.1 hypothetical protein [Streptomyces olivaceus]
MARAEFGAGIADYVVTPSDGLWAVGANTVITFWDSRDGGTQYTDLQDASGSPITEVVTDEFGALPAFRGPDSVLGMWAEGLGGTRVWISARDAAGGGGGGGSAAYTALVRVVASATAPADVRAAAAYVCDGVADQDTIQQAIHDAQDGGGGVVMLSPGGFNLTAPIQIAGTANEDDPLTVSLVGCGEHATVLRPAINSEAAIVLTNWAQCHLEKFGIEIMGSTTGIVSTAVTTTDTRSFWDSSFRDLRIFGFYEATYTGWAMDLSMPFRSVFENIEIEGTRNGIRLLNDSDVQNAGDCTFTRMFIEIVGDNGVAIHVSSPANNMNQNNFNMVEAGANGEGCTAILIDGESGGASQRFWGTNLEQFDTLIDVANGESNTFDLNYATCRDGYAGAKAFVFGDWSHNNRVSARWVNINSAGALKLIEDLNDNIKSPNIYDGIRIEANAGSNTTYEIANRAIMRDIISQDTGTVQAGLLTLTPNSQVVTLTDAATIATNAARSTHFKVALTANRTLGVPTNPSDGQRVIWEVTASGGARTLSLAGGAGGFAFGSDITALTAIASGKTDFIGAVYSATANAWRVVAYAKGY